MPTKKGKNNKGKRTNRKGKSSRGGISGYRTSPGRTYTNTENIHLTFFDPHKYITLRYVEEFSNSILTSAGAQQTMNLNSLFDPNRTGSGHQPMGFDTVASLYNRYRVLKVRVTVKFIASANYMIVVIPLNGLLVSSIADQATYQTACEQRMAQKRDLSSGGPSTTVKMNPSLDKVNGCLKVEYLADDRFEAAVGSSPTEIITLSIGLFNPTGATIVPYYSVTMDFLCDFHDPISLGPSSVLDTRRSGHVPAGTGMRLEELQRDEVYYKRLLKQENLSSELRAKHERNLASIQRFLINKASSDVLL